ncbi:hypothetical protein AB1Y20_002338 [Prymnesium parvum]|uniref:Uncharacterized protein n=1 Tax=Prymnesium parvum TaxID=97485 RepID=A0AB34J893_PRYPA
MAAIPSPPPPHAAPTRPRRAMHSGVALRGDDAERRGLHGGVVLRGDEAERGGPPPAPAWVGELHRLEENEWALLRGHLNVTFTLALALVLLPGALLLMWRRRAILRRAARVRHIQQVADLAAHHIHMRRAAARREAAGGGARGAREHGAPKRKARGGAARRAEGKGKAAAAAAMLEEGTARHGEARGAVRSGCGEAARERGSPVMANEGEGLCTGEESVGQPAQEGMSLAALSRLFDETLCGMSASFGSGSGAQLEADEEDRVDAPPRTPSNECACGGLATDGTTLPVALCRTEPYICEAHGETDQSSNALPHVVPMDEREVSWRHFLRPKRYMNLRTDVETEDPAGSPPSLPLAA